MLSKDIKYVSKSLKKRSGIRSHLIYKFTTENISGYIKEFNLKNRSLLTVGSSGDQAINANFCGCNYVTVVDLNRYTEYYFYLKKAAIIALNYEEFLRYFSLDSDDLRMSIKTYKKIREILREISLDSLIFWDYVYDHYNLSNKCNNLFHYHSDELVNINVFNPYLNDEENYNIEKNKIKNMNIKFINADILKPDRIFTWEKFDNINLSNVYGYNYNDNRFKIAKFKKGINSLVERLNDDGIMLVAYLYGTSHNSSMIKFANDNILEDVTYSHFKGIRGIYKKNGITDTAVMYQKKLVK